MLDEIRVKIYEVEPIIRMRGYDYMPVAPGEFLDYMTGPTPTGDEITLRDVLDCRFLMVHELVEMS